MNAYSKPPLAAFHFFPHLPTELRLKIYEHILSLSHASHSSTRILKISFSPSLGCYVSNTPPPITLAISPESRLFTLSTHSYLSLGPLPKFLKPLLPTVSSSSSISPYPKDLYGLPIPIAYTTDILYLSSLSPLLSTHLHSILYHFSTSPSRHLIQHLAIDFRVWAELCENGFLGIVSRMKALREVDLVVEFGRAFDGEVGFLECPAWRRDLKWVAEGAERGVQEERRRVVRTRRDGIGAGSGGLGDVRVRCVILTRGGEQS
ncbi:hypothetical protein ONS95_013987 [Cadophora gregata]|uniref:uncharacterized protein n=1 Tax=Cadophora gregata TaxID=51156 RepID=UPI0026DB16C0|nr:uncharacterized protein ONS95_013987 [Cadophora gregata]KAK0113739.1 hypothetical protein ONS96_014594 [Cadophora gregata f. sp. sojae]KAK0114497.1 hypothetical protein ONS95_013987 [Cadophora gregata]